MILRNIMLTNSLIFGILVSFVINVSCSDKTESRTTNYILNPDLPTNMSNHNINVVYLRSSSSIDVLHFIFSAGNYTETPSIILMRSSDLSSKLSIDWDQFTSSDVELRKNSIKQIGKNFTSHFGVIFNKIYQYNDVDDNVNMDGKPVISWTFDQFDWTLSMDPKSFNVAIRTSTLKSGEQIFKNNGSQIILEIDYKNVVVYNSVMPYLQFNTNNIQFNMILNKLVISYSNARYAFGFALVNIENKNPMYFKELKSISDEHSPGVFRTVNFYGQKDGGNPDDQTYVQFKPICYTKENSYTLDGISVSHYSNPKVLETPNTQFLNTSDVFKSSAVYLAYGDHIFQPLSQSYLVNITFGSAKDKFYKDYVLWTASFGIGPPPTYVMSITIIMVIIFGLGLPFLIVIVGSIYIIIKKRKNKKRVENYETIGETIN